MCGIFGQINSKTTNFDVRFFNMAGVLNDSRGGDSCGIVIDDKKEIGVDKNKLYANFFANSELINNTEKCRLAIGHTRKASVGSINEYTAQPVVIYNENGEMDFCLMHNGTIKNYKELAKNAGIIADVNSTDSMVLAEIIYKKGYDVLEDYIGAAALIMVDYRKNRKSPDVRLFKGYSKSSNAYNSKEEDERPLYYARLNDSFYFSSIQSVLTGMISTNVYSLPSNKLIRLAGHDNKLILEKEYDRVKTMNDYLNSLKVSSYEPSYEYNNYGYGYGGFNSSRLQEKEEEEKKIASNTLRDLNVGYCNKVCFTSSGYILKNRNVPDVVLDGTYRISSYGYIMDEKSKNYAEEYNFLNGVFIPCKEAYEVLVQMRDAYIKDRMSDKKNPPMFSMEDAIDEFFDYNEDVIGLFAFGGLLFSPVKRGESVAVYAYEKFGEEIISHAYTGTFIPLFNTKALEYTVDNGDITHNQIINSSPSYFSVKDQIAGTKAYSLDVIRKIANL